VFLRERRLMLPPLALSIALVAVVAGCEPEPHAMRRTPGPSEQSQAESSQVWQVKRIQTPGANPLVVGEEAIWIAGSSSGDGGPMPRCSAWIPPPDESSARPTSGTCTRTSSSRSSPLGG
jgi:hypothetical protein